jgi:hypothetical protein
MARMKYSISYMLIQKKCSFSTPGVRGIVDHEAEWRAPDKAKMDPISLIGLLSSLSSLIGASKKVIDLINSFKDGDKELIGLSNSVSLFEENLKGFKRVLRSRWGGHNISVETINNAIKESAGMMKELEDRLLSIFKSESLTVRRMKWVQHKSTFEKITEDLKGKCMMLHSLVSVAQLYMIQIIDNETTTWLTYLVL